MYKGTWISTTIRVVINTLWNVKEICPRLNFNHCGKCNNSIFFENLVKICVKRHNSEIQGIQKKENLQNTYGQRHRRYLEMKKNQKITSKLV